MTVGPRKKVDDVVANTTQAIRNLYHGWSTILAIFILLVGVVGVVAATYIDSENVWHHIVRDLSIAFIVSGVVSSAYEYLLRDSFVKDTGNSIRDVLKEKNGLGQVLKELHEGVDQLEQLRLEELLRQVLREQNSGLNQLNGLGLKNIYERLDAHLLTERCKNAASIKILQTWLGLEKDEIWAIEQAAAKECEIRILLLDPFSAQVPYRASALWESGGSAEKRAMRLIADHLEQLNDIGGNSDQGYSKYNIHVKVYDAAPTIQIYEFDRTKLIGMYRMHYYTIQGPQFEIVDSVDSEKSLLAGAIDDHFDRLWEHKSTRDASEAVNEYQHWENTGLTLANLPLEEHRYWKSTGLPLEEYQKWRSTSLPLKQYLQERNRQEPLDEDPSTVI